MDIQNSRDFSYAKQKSRTPQTTEQTRRADSLSVHGIIVTMLFGIKHLLTGYPDTCFYT